MSLSYLALSKNVNQIHLPERGAARISGDWDSKTTTEQARQDKLSTFRLTDTQCSRCIKGCQSSPAYPLDSSIFLRAETSCNNRGGLIRVRSRGWNLSVW